MAANTGIVFLWAVTIFRVYKKYVAYSSKRWLHSPVTEETYIAEI
jgi:hypothetical protein